MYATVSLENSVVYFGGYEVDARVQDTVAEFIDNNWRKIGKK